MKVWFGSYQKHKNNVNNSNRQKIQKKYPPHPLLVNLIKKRFRINWIILQFNFQLLKITQKFLRSWATDTKLRSTHKRNMIVQFAYSASPSVSGHWPVVSPLLKSSMVNRCKSRSSPTYPNWIWRHVCWVYNSHCLSLQLGNYINW